LPWTRSAECGGVARIYAVGDAAAYPVKHGGIAAQQADVAALSIAALAGVAVTPRPFRPTIDGVLVTGGQPRHLAWPLGQAR
jgi:NADH dehydrogenase FAD-containing subunit